MKKVIKEIYKIWRGIWIKKKAKKGQYAIFKENFLYMVDSLNGRSDKIR